MKIRLIIAASIVLLASCGGGGDPSVTESWPQQWGTAVAEFANGITIDSANNIYVAGKTQGALDGQAASGGYDLFVTKYNSSGTKQWARQLGTTMFDTGKAITSDSVNNIYVAGFSFGALDGQTSAGNEDIIVTKYNSSGARQWTQQLGTTSSDLAYGIAVDSADKIYITGYTGGDLDGNISAGNFDAYIVKYASDGIKQ